MLNKNYVTIIPINKCIIMYVLCIIMCHNTHHAVPVVQFHVSRPQQVSTGIRGGGNPDIEPSRLGCEPHEAHDSRGKGRVHRCRPAHRRLYDV